MRLTGSHLLLAASLGIATITAAEISARVEDWVSLGVPLTHTPDHNHDLQVRVGDVIRGRPHGQYDRFRLNAFGFHGGEINPQPRPGCIRIMALGASETFGYLEAPGKDYPAQLQDTLRAHGCFEVVNAAIVGMGLGSIRRLWSEYAWHFSPEVVLIYPSPAFYVIPRSPRQVRASPNTARPAAPGWQLRIVKRIKDGLEMPAFIQRRRIAYYIMKQTAGMPPSWFLVSAPPEGVVTFVAELDSLVSAIQERGATPILMTHATVFRPPYTDAELALMESWRQFSPRARASALLDMERVGADQVRALGARRGVRVIDVDSAVSGQRDLFGDPVHFTTKGSGVVAGVIAHELLGGAAPLRLATAHPQ